MGGGSGSSQPSTQTTKTELPSWLDSAAQQYVQQGAQVADSEGGPDQDHGDDQGEGHGGEEPQGQGLLHEPVEHGGTFRR